MSHHLILWEILVGYVHMIIRVCGSELNSLQKAPEVYWRAVIVENLVHTCRSHRFYCGFKNLLTLWLRAQCEWNLMVLFSHSVKRSKVLMTFTVCINKTDLYLVGFDDVSELRRQEDVRLVGRMSDVHQHTTLTVRLVHVIVHVTSAAKKEGQGHSYWTQRSCDGYKLISWSLQKTA